MVIGKSSTLLLLPLLCFFVFAEATQADAQGSPKLTVSVLKGADTAMTIETVSSQEYASRFIPKQIPFFLPPGDSVAWLRIVVEYPDKTAGEQWFLDFNWNYLSGLDVFFPGPRGFVHEGRGDWNIYVDSVFKLPRTTGSRLTCYVRASEYNGANLNPKIVLGKSLQNRDIKRAWLLGILFGVMAAMFFYNLLLCFSLKDASYVWYVAHLLFLMFNYLYLNGLYAFVFGGYGEESFVRNMRIYYSGNAFLFFSMVMFAKSFLLTKKESPTLDKLLAGLAVLASLLLPAALFASLETAGELSSVVGLASAVMLPICGGIRMVAGFKPARIFFFGWSAYLIGGVLHVLAWVGAVAPTAFAIHALQGGTVIEVMAMSLALAYRVKIFREEKRRTEEENERLAEKNALFSIMLDNSDLGIGLVKGGVFSWANKRLEEMVAKGGRLSGVPIHEFPGFLKLLGDPGRQAGRGSLKREGQVDAKGARKDMRALGQVVGGASEGDEVVWVVEDVTEQKRLERLKDDFGKILHHNLKSPLAAINSITSVIKDFGPLSERQEHCCALISETSTRALQQLEIVLSLYKIEEQKFNPDLSVVLLDEILSEMFEELIDRINYNAKDIRIACAKDLKSVRVLGDKILIHAALVNLLENALEATPDGESVDVVVEDGEEVLIHITNHGVVAPAIRDTFFEKFVTYGKAHGTGIGTYCARLFSRALGGDVALDVTREGYTTVTARFQSAGDSPPGQT